MYICIYIYLYIYIYYMYVPHGPLVDAHTYTHKQKQTHTHTITHTHTHTHNMYRNHKKETRIPERYESERESEESEGELGRATGDRPPSLRFRSRFKNSSIQISSRIIVFQDNLKTKNLRFANNRKSPIAFCITLPPPCTIFFKVVLQCV